MVKIALRKLFAGILCGVVWCLGWWWNEWGKTIQTYPHSNCTFHHQNSQRVQTNFTVPTNLGNFGQHNLPVPYVSLSACWKIGLNPFNNKHGENCIVQAVCWYSVWLRSAAGACQLWWMIGKKRPIISKPHSNCTFSQPEFTKKIRALYHTIQPQGKSIYLSLSLSPSISRGPKIFQHNLLYLLKANWPISAFISACRKQKQNPWYQKRLLVFCMVEWCCLCWWWSERGKKHPNISIF